MPREKMAEIISYLIGVALMATMYFIAKRKQELPERKVFGFPLSKVAAALTIYFFVMAVWVYFK